MQTNLEKLLTRRFTGRQFRYAPLSSVGLVVRVSKPHLMKNDSMTKKLTLYIYSKSGSFCLDIDNNSETAFVKYLELISIFWEVDVKNGKIKLNPVQRMDTEKRDKYNEFIGTYKSNTPILNRLKASLDKISDGEYFFTSNKPAHTTEESLFVGNLIDSYNTSSSDEETANKFEEITSQFNEFFGGVLKNYEFKVFDAKQKIKIGESDRKKRICRFCGNGMSTDIKVTFNSKAHAFSEALGNKSVVLNEECDTCNGKLGSSIEEDFIKYLDIYRAFYKIKGKNSTAKLKFKNATIQEIDGLTTIMAQNIEHDKESGNFTILLESNSKLANVNIYKTLCKYAISVIDKVELAYFKKTIEWITSDKKVDASLPKVAVGVSNGMYVDVPSLGLYIRKNDNSSYPYVVAEFRFKALIFVFLLPFCSRDKSDFSDDASYKKLWKLFQHYSSLKTWSFNDFSSYDKEKFQFRMKMINQKP